MSSASQGTIKIADKLKNQITENTTTIRAMRSNQTEVRNFTNFIFLTNRPDAVKIEDGDRRYNIAPRQEVKLEDAHPEVIEQIDDIYKELHDFAGILKTYEVNTRLVRTCVNNDAKTEMRHVSMSVFEEFCQALKRQARILQRCTPDRNHQCYGWRRRVACTAFCQRLDRQSKRGLHNDQRRTLACCVPRIDRTNPSPQRKRICQAPRSQRTYKKHVSDKLALIEIATRYVALRWSGTSVMSYEAN